jgi:hypothetical protein
VQINGYIGVATRDSHTAWALTVAAPGRSARNVADHERPPEDAVECSRRRTDPPLDTVGTVQRRNGDAAGSSTVRRCPAEMVIDGGDGADDDPCASGASGAKTGRSESFDDGGTPSAEAAPVVPDGMSNDPAQAVVAWGVRATGHAAAGEDAAGVGSAPEDDEAGT